MKGERDGSAVPNLIIYLLYRLLRYSPWAVVTDGCWEVKWAKRFVRMLPLYKADAALYWEFVSDTDQALFI